MAAFTLIAAPRATAVVGGEVIPVGRAPWTAVIGVKGPTGTSTCGGATLDTRRIVTAAPCLVGDTSATPVIVGTSNAPTLSATTQPVGAASIRKHPYFLKSSLNKCEPDDDVDVVTTAAPLDPTRPSAQPIARLAGAKPPVGTARDQRLWSPEWAARF